MLAFYGAKGGVGTTTLAINTAIALHRVLRRSVVLVDADLQFGDHRVFLDLGNDKRSIVDAVTAPAIDGDLLRQVVVRHDSGVDLLLAPPNPETAEHVSAERHHMAQIVETLRGCTTTWSSIWTSGWTITASMSSPPPTACSWS